MINRLDHETTSEILESFHSELLLRRLEINPNRVDRLDHETTSESLGGFHSECTVNRTSLLERFSFELFSLSIYVLVGVVVTGVASVFLTTPLSLLGINTPSIVELLAISGALVVVSGILYYASGTGEFMSVKPGDEIEGFDDLPEQERMAMIAIDDAKLTRLSSGTEQPNVLDMIVSLGFVTYLCVLAYINVGALGVLVAPGLFVLKTIGRLVALIYMKDFEQADSEYLDELVAEIKERARANTTIDIDPQTEPTLLVYGDEDNSVHENTAMALPEFNTILLPQADVKKLPREELRSVLAHEYKHVESHHSLVLTLCKFILLVLPGLALFGLGPVSPVVVGAGLFIYFALINATLALVSRRRERQADAFATEVASPLGLAFALTRLADERVLDTNSESLLAGPSGELYGSHPYTHQRVETLIQDETE